MLTDTPDMLWEHRYEGSPNWWGYSTDEERAEIESSLTVTAGSIEWRQVPNPNKRPPLTRDQKRRLAWALLDKASTLTEFWSEAAAGYDCEDIDYTQATEQIARWLRKLPSDAWPATWPNLPK